MKDAAVVDKKHHELSPSQFDIWAECPCYESSPVVGTAAAEGTRQHGYMEQVLAGEESDKYDDMSAGDKANVEWFCDLVRMHCPATAKIETEQKVVATDGFDILYSGTADAITGPIIYDYKSDREWRSHYYQMAAYAYALMTMRGLKEVRAIVGYGRMRKLSDYTFKREDAERATKMIIAARKDPDRKPRVCDYCAWCHRRNECEAHFEMNAAAVMQSDSGMVLNRADCIAAMNDPMAMGRVLNVISKVESWCEMMRKRAKEMAIEGNVPSGYMLKEQQNKKLTDPVGVYSRLSMIITPQEFNAALHIKVTELREAIARKEKVSAASAKRMLDELCGDLYSVETVAILRKQKQNGENDHA